MSGRPLVAWAAANVGRSVGSAPTAGPLVAWHEALGDNGRVYEGGGVRPTFGRLSIDEASLLLQGLLLVDCHQLVHGEEPISRALNQGRLRYIRRDPHEHWRTIREIWHFGGGDCEDLATAVAAEACFATGQVPLGGGYARPVLYRVRPGLSHVVTQLVGSGELLDPSRTGGMGRE